MRASGASSATSRVRARRLPDAVRGPAEEWRLRKRVEELVAEVFGLAPGEVKTHARLREDLGVDSFDVLELAMEVQSRFGVEISDEELEEVETIGDFCSCTIAAMSAGKDPTREG